MFRKFLDTLPRDRCNVFLQAGGKRRVPEDRIQEFAEQFDKARATWTKQSFESVVWAPPRCA